MLVETASDESGGDKASWIASIKYELRRSFPKVSTLIWFNQDEGQSRLSVDSSANTLKAYRSLAGDPHLSGSLPR